MTRLIKLTADPERYLRLPPFRRRARGRASGPALQGKTKPTRLAVAHGLAETTAGAGATLDSVLPGSTDSEGVTTFVGKMAETQGRSEMEDEFFRSDRPSSLLGRFIEPEEVAVVVAYGSSPLSSTTNVASLRAGGGVVRSIF